MTDEARNAAILKLGMNRELAHRTLFAHRHPQATPQFHKKLIGLWHGDDAQVLTEQNYCTAALDREVDKDGNQIFDLTPPPDPRDRK